MSVTLKGVSFLLVFKCLCLAGQAINFTVTERRSLALTKLRTTRIDKGLIWAMNRARDNLLCWDR